jgi:hypothetical protein
MNRYCSGPTHATPGSATIAVSPTPPLSAMQAQDPTQIAHLLAELRVEHRDLDTAIEHLARALGRDELQLTRMKKRKLLLKDTIARLESKLIPDLDA